MTQTTAAIFTGFFYTVRLVQEAPDLYRASIEAHHPSVRIRQREATSTNLTQAHAFFTHYVAETIESEQNLAVIYPEVILEIEEAHTELWAEDHKRDEPLRQIIKEQAAKSGIYL